MDFNTITHSSEWNKLTFELPECFAPLAMEFYSNFRGRKIPTLNKLLRAVLIWVAEDLSLKDTAASLGALGISISAPSLHARFEKAADWLAVVLSIIVSGDSRGRETASTRVLLADSSSLCGPGSKGTDFRVHALFDCATGAMCGIELTDSLTGESADLHPLGLRSLVIYDRGYSNSKNIHAHAACGAHFLIRANPGSIRICNESLDLVMPNRLESAIRENEPFELRVKIPLRPRHGKGAKWHHAAGVTFVHARLIGIRTPKGVLWLLTDMPPEELSAVSAGALYRRRWQIELFFKHLKSLGGLDKLKRRDGPTARTWIFGKLIHAALAQRHVPPFETHDSEIAYLESAYSRFRMAHAAVRFAVAGAIAGLVCANGGLLARMRNTPRKRLRQAPVGAISAQHPCRLAA